MIGASSSMPKRRGTCNAAIGIVVVSEGDVGIGSNDREVVDESRLYVLGSTKDGWAVWDRTSAADEPLVRYPLTDDGFDLASEYFAQANRGARMRRVTRLGVLRWITITAGVAWIALNAVVQIRINGIGGALFGSEEEYEVIRWAQTLGGIAYSVLLVAVGAYVLLWVAQPGAAAIGRLPRGAVIAELGQAVGHSRDVARSRGGHPRSLSPCTCATAA